MGFSGSRYDRSEENMIHLRFSKKLRKAVYPVRRLVHYPSRNHVRRMQEDTRVVMLSDGGRHKKTGIKDTIAVNAGENHVNIVADEDVIVISDDEEPRVSEKAKENTTTGCKDVINLCEEGDGDATPDEKECHDICPDKIPDWRKRLDLYRKTMQI